MFCAQQRTLERAELAVPRGEGSTRPNRDASGGGGEAGQRAGGGSWLGARAERRATGMNTWCNSESTVTSLLTSLVTHC